MISLSIDNNSIEASNYQEWRLILTPKVYRLALVFQEGPYHIYCDNGEQCLDVNNPFEILDIVDALKDRFGFSRTPSMIIESPAVIELDLSL